MPNQNFCTETSTVKVFGKSFFCEKSENCVTGTKTERLIEKSLLKKPVEK